MRRKIPHNRGGFTLVEIMIVVAIIALLAAIAVPGFLRARKRSQATAILNDARVIGGAVDQYAIENSVQGTTTSLRRVCISKPGPARCSMTSSATTTATARSILASE
jgi:prepilin-type N-terminal cleavage/methylation domain-containing protein